MWMTDVRPDRHNTVLPQNLWLSTNFLPSDFIPVDVTSAHFMTVIAKAMPRSREASFEFEFRTAEFTSLATVFCGVRIQLL